MKQAIQEPLAGQIGIDQFDILNGCDQRLAFDSRGVVRDRVGNAALRRIAWMQIGLARWLLPRKPVPDEGPQPR